MLSPTASQRAAKYGGKPSDYERLFTTHAECILKARHTLPSKPVVPAFEQAELLMLRQREALQLGVEAGSRQTAEYVNRLSGAELLEKI